MSLRTFVIVSSITNLSDARYCAGMGADVLGFCLEPGLPNTIGKAAFKEITGWVAGVQVLGEFSQLGAEEINQLADEHQLNFVQLNRLYPIKEIEKINYPIILHLPVSEEETLATLRQLMETYFAEVDYFLLSPANTLVPGSGTTSLLRDLAQVFPILLSAGITVENMLPVLDVVKPAGICLQGGQEMKPGLRDFEELAGMLEILEAEE